MMIEDFSGGYYRATLDIQRYKDGPVVQQDFYDFINRELYCDHEAPVMMRVGLDAGEVFGVGSEAAMPSDVLALPSELVDEQGEASVFVLKPDHAETMGNYYG